MRDWNSIRKPVWIQQQHITETVDITRQILFSESYPNLDQNASSIIYYIKNLQYATLAVLFISNCKITLRVSDAFCVHHHAY